MSALLPGSTIGILGSGQLGRMLAIAARRMGYRTHVYSPDANSPAEAVADATTIASYTDLVTLETFARSVDVVTFEFENIPFESASKLADWVTVRPEPAILHTAQHRAREKIFLKESGFPVVPFAMIRKAGDVAAALDAIGVPSVLKTAGFGYDGKGQHKITSREQVAPIVAASAQEWVLEQWQEFDKEISVGIARSVDRKMADWGAVENRHRNHILDVSVVPAAISEETEREAVRLARAIAEKMHLVGLLFIEFFVGKDGSVRINEMAPRPHNSGHWTIEGAVTNQFEQQLRAVCGLPLGSPYIVAPTAMANVLGDVWTKGEPNWVAVLGDPFVKWHSYGKSEARPGRKMGHLTSLGSTAEEAVERVLKARQAL
jgi:5-(carboxyamino)imidazole ribonucleotide synthase